MAELRIENLTKFFGSARAVDDISLSVGDGEFLTLLGPSGCGKSTTLGAIAGLERPDLGHISLGGQVFFDAGGGVYLPPEQREIGLVFQSYALWPHKTVYKNLEFPLQLRKIPVAERKRRIDSVLDLVEMTAFASRFPYALSGGQQQRVALARTLVYAPRLLLLDEPLSNLDAKLRERARIWLRDIQNRVNVTTIYVTHDQVEALALSDRIAVMSGGKIIQLGTPQTIYDRPATPFVADFIGSANIFDARIDGTTATETRLRLDDGSALVVSRPAPEGANGKCSVAVRPESISFIAGEGSAPGNTYNVGIEARSFLGARRMVMVRLGRVNLRVECDWEPGTERADIHIPPEACTLFHLSA